MDVNLLNVCLAPPPKKNSYIEILALRMTVLGGRTFRTVVLNLWVETPLGIEWPFHRSQPRLLENTGVYITIHNRGKITVMK